MNRARITMHRLMWVGISVVLAAGLSFAPRRSSSKDLQEQSDNTELNKGGASKEATMAVSEKTNRTGRAPSQKIHAEIMKDKSLTTNAHNIKVISQNRKATLKGSVRTSDKKAAVEDKAAAAAGERTVTSEIANVPPKS